MSYIETRLIIDGKSYDGRQIELIELGRNVERSRIIKLLEERYAENVDHCEWGTHLFLDNAIELIKGETHG